MVKLIRKTSSEVKVVGTETRDRLHEFVIKMYSGEVQVPKRCNVKQWHERRGHSGHDKLRGSLL